MRYIDADRLLSESTLSRTASNWDTCITVDDIDACPTEDVAPVKHAKWIYHGWVIASEDFEGEYECSDCHAAVPKSSFELDSFHKKYCGACGAKMDEEREEPQ